MSRRWFQIITLSERIERYLRSPNPYDRYWLIQDIKRELFYLHNSRFSFKEELTKFYLLNLKKIEKIKLRNAKIKKRNQKGKRK